MSEKSSSKKTTSKSKSASASSPKSLSDVLKIIEDNAATNRGSAMEALTLLSQGSTRIKHEHYYKVLREQWRTLPVQTKAIKYAQQMADISTVPEKISEIIIYANTLPVTRKQSNVNIHEVRNHHGWPMVRFHITPDDYNAIEVTFVSEHVACMLYLYYDIRTVGKKESSKSPSKHQTYCFSAVNFVFAPSHNFENDIASIDHHTVLDVSCEAIRTGSSLAINSLEAMVRSHIPDSYKKVINENNQLLFDSWVPAVKAFKMMKKQWVSYPKKEVSYRFKLNGVSQIISGTIDAPISSLGVPNSKKATGEKEFINLRKAFPEKFAALYADLKLD